MNDIIADDSVRLPAEWQGDGEHRSIYPGGELRLVESRGGGLSRIDGYALLFDSLSEDLGGFREAIAPGATNEALAPGKEVLALMHHDVTQVIGRRSAGTLDFKIDGKGVFVTVILPDTQLGRDAAESVRRGDLKSWSFRFSGAVDTWSRDETGMRIRRITKIGTILEFSVVTVPAYPSTTLSARETPEVYDAEHAALLANADRASARESRLEVSEERLSETEAEDQVWEEIRLDERHYAAEAKSHRRAEFLRRETTLSRETRLREAEQKIEEDRQAVAARWAEIEWRQRYAGYAIATRDMTPAQREEYIFRSENPMQWDPKKRYPSLAYNSW
jgi:HK97 family phage prohead protease